MTGAEVLRELVTTATAKELPQLAGALAQAHAEVLARIASPVNVTPAESPARAPLLTVAEAAERLGVKRSWLYRHSKKLPFVRKVGGRTLKFDAQALERWIAAQGRAA